MPRVAGLVSDGGALFMLFPRRCRGVARLFFLLVFCTMDSVDIESVSDGFGRAFVQGMNGLGTRPM